MVDWLHLAPLLLSVMLLIPASVSDVLYRRIPNMLSLGGFLLAVVMHGVLGGWSGFFWAFAAGLMLLVLMFPFFVIGWMGAGDVKLIAAVGAISGSLQAALVSLVAIVSVGGLMGLVAIAWRKGLFEFLGSIFTSVVMSAMTRRPMYVMPDGAAASRKIPYAVAITSGTLIVMAAKAAGIN